MKSILLAVGAALAVCACASTTGPQTAWGKEGVSMLDYRHRRRSVRRARGHHASGGNGANTAGGIEWQNTQRGTRPRAARASPSAYVQVQPPSASRSIADRRRRRLPRQHHADMVSRVPQRSSRPQEIAAQRSALRRSRAAWWSAATRNSR